MGKGKTEFTRQEYEEILSLVSQLETATSDKKKNIRGKIRNLGLYWSEVSGNIQYTTSNLDSLANRGILKIIDTDNETNPSSINKFDTLEKKFNSPNIEARKKSIFISYKRLDKDKVFPIKARIEKSLGDICWIDIDGIESDAQFVSVIIKAIKECNIFLFMYSSAHNKIEDYTKDWTIRELQYAEQLNKKIVFINIDRSELGDWFSFMFGQKQQIDALSEEALSHLIEDLNTWLGKEETGFSDKDNLTKYLEGRKAGKEIEIEILSLKDEIKSVFKKKPLNWKQRYIDLCNQLFICQTNYYAPSQITHMHAYEDLGDAFEKIGNFQKKLELYEDAYKLKNKYNIKGNREFFKSFYNIGEMYYQLGDKTTAKIKFQEAIKFMPICHPKVVDIKKRLEELGENN